MRGRRRVGVWLALGLAVTSLPVAGAAHVAGAEPSLAPAWAAGIVFGVGNGNDTHGGVYVTNVAGYGENAYSFPTTTPVADIYDVQAVAAGWHHSLALLGDGTVWAWGEGAWGSMGPTATNPQWSPAPVGLSGVAAISAGPDTSLALKTGGTVWSWGDNRYGGLGNGTPVDQNQHPNPVQVALTGTFTAIASGRASLALRSDGTVWAWGSNQYGDLGIGSTHSAYSTTPVQVKNLTGVVAIAAGLDHYMAVKSDGTLWAWGHNGYWGQLGDGTTTDRSAPVQVTQSTGLTNVVQVAVGDRNSVALDAAGHVWTWGDARFGEAGTPPPQPYYPQNSSITPVEVPSFDNVIKIAKTTSSTLAEKSDGTLWAWGWNSNGQLGTNDLSVCINVPQYNEVVRCADVPTQVVGVQSPGSFAIGDTMVLSNGGSITPQGSLVGQALTRPVSEMLGYWPGQASMADPVDIASGNFAYDANDLVAQNGAYGAEWQRTYNSRSAASGPLGQGWSTSFSDHITMNGNGDAILTKADGRAVTFANAGNGAFTRPSDEFANLTRLGDGTFRLDLFDGENWTFDASGRLSTKTNWDGVTATATYAPDGSLTEIANSSGPSLAFTYASGSLTDVATSDGRHATYAFTNGALSSATTPATGITTYGLDTHGYLAAITDANNANVATNAYDAAGRVLTQTTGGGSPTTFVYDDSNGITRVTDGATNQTLTYTHDAEGRVRATYDSAGGIAAKTYDPTSGYLTTSTNRLGGNESLTYDGNGNVTGDTNANNVLRTIAYDSQNRPTTVLDAATGTHTYTYTGNERVPTSVTVNDKTTTFEVTNGRITKQTDPDGVVTSFSYDPNRRLSSSTLAPNTPLAATTSYTYDTAGHVLTVTDALNHTTTYTYTTGGQLESKTDPLNHTTNYTYDAAGHQLTTTDPTNAVTTNTYDSAGRLASTETPRGLLTRYSYDALGELVTTTLPDGTSTTRKTYGPLGRVATSIDELNRSTANRYDKDGNVTGITDPTNAVTTSSFDVGARPTGTVDPLGRTSSSTTYDAAGHLASTTTLGGLTTSYGYDTSGRVKKTTDPRGGNTSTTYSDGGRVQTVTTPNNVTTTDTYDAAGRLWKETTAAGDAVHEYDLAGNEVRTTTRGGLVIQRTYDDAGNILTVIDPAGVTTTYTHTARGELASTTRTGAGTVSYTYDPDGNLASVTDANDHTTTFGYDNRDRRTSRTDANNNTTSWTYDAAGQMTSRTDPKNRTTTFTYDADGRLVTTTDPSGRSTTRHYDAAGQLTSLSYADNSSVSFTYDNAGRRASATNTSGTTTYTYEPGGELTQFSRPDGRVITYSYDTAGRKSKMILPDGSSYTYTYDNQSRLASITPNETLADTFTGTNGANPDTSKWTRTVASGATATIQTNALNLTLPNTSGASVTVASTAPNTTDSDVTLTYKLGDVSSGATLQVHARDSGNAYWLEIPNDSSTVTLKKKVGATTTTIGSFTSPNDTNTHGLRLRVQGTSISARIWDATQTEPSTWNLQATDSAITAAGNTTLVFTRASRGHTATIDNLTYQNLSNPPTAVATFGYDADNHLTSETLPGGNRTWTWTNGRVTRLDQTLPGAPTTETVHYDTSGRIDSDTIGNNTTAYTYDAADQLISAAPTGAPAATYAYDTLGRRESATTGSTTTNYTYDTASQLLSSTTGSTTTNYTYDGAGRRLTETTGSATTTYTYDAAGRLGTYSRAGTTQTRTYDPDDALIALSNTTGSTTTATKLDWDRTTDVPQLVQVAGTGSTTLFDSANDEATAIRQGATANALALDAYGSVISTPSTAPIARASSYDAYGNAPGTPTFDPRLGYRGELITDNLIHLRARNYQPTTAAFTTVDPRDGTPGTPTIVNPYNYANNNPLNETDPSGNSPGVSAFVGLDSVFEDSVISGGGSLGFVAPPETSVGIPLAALAFGTAAVAGPVIFGATTGVPLPGDHKLCFAWCRGLENDQRLAAESENELYSGWARAFNAVEQNHPTEVVTVWHEVNAGNRSDGTFSKSGYKSQMNYSDDSYPPGVSFFEIPGLPGNRPYAFPMAVYVRGGRGAVVPNTPYPVEGPECWAQQTPQNAPDRNSAPYHWDIDCGGKDKTRDVLRDYAYHLFNPPWPNPAL